jgi:osmotically-inducible protein OsmY
MSTTTLSDRDVRTRDDVLHQLEWDPDVDADSIGVTAHDGAVTLTGYVDSYTGKLEAERAAKRVRGVRAVANELRVRLRLERIAEEIARDAAAALRQRPGLPSSVQATVRYGHLVLTGHVPWLFHRTAAELAVRHIPGVVEVTNRIEVLPLASRGDIRRRITETLEAMADINIRLVNVTVRGSTVTLTGAVRSWSQRDAIERAAADAPGIGHVENLIEVTDVDAPD